MICKNCGSENFAENASVCGICDLPLDGASTVALAEQGNAGPEAADNSKAVPMEDAEDEKLDLSDPIDFIMNQPESEISPANNDNIGNSADYTQSIKTESSQQKKDGFNVFDVNSTAPASSDAGHTPESSRQGTEFNPTRDRPKPVAVGAGFGTLEIGATQDVAATKKISTENFKKELSPGLSIQRPAAEQNDMSRVARSRGIILFSGDTLTLTGETRVFAGDEVWIGDQLLQVRPKPKSYGKALGMIALVMAIAGVTLAYFGGYIPIGNGRLIGVVLGSGNYPLSDMTVRIVENNQSVTTNQAGFFVFEGLDSGLYTIQVLKDGKPWIEERIAVVDNEIITITLFESKSISYTPDDYRSPPKIGEKRLL